MLGCVMLDACWDHERVLCGLMCEERVLYVLGVLLMCIGVGDVLKMGCR